MSQNFIDTLAEIHKINSKDLFKGFRELFHRVKIMESNELIATRQAIDLALDLNQEKINEQQEVILMHIIDAMQERAVYFYNIWNIDARQLGRLFHIDSNGFLDLYYDHELKGIMPILEETPEPELAVQKKRSWFSFKAVS